MKRILMVDDVATNLRCATEILKDNYEITAVKSGKAALEALGHMIPDLLLVDINMPEMSGFELFERVKEMPELSGVPVVFLTAETDKDVEAKGIQMGAADFIKKPFEPYELINRIASVFESGAHRHETAVIKKNTAGLLMERNKERLRTWADLKDTKGFFVLINLENFNQIDENLGSFAKEEVFMKIAEVLQEIPESDTCFCHIRDNVFGTYFDGNHSMDSIKTTIRRMIAEMEFEINEIISDDLETKITVTAGIAEKPEDGTDYENLFRHADKALYFVREIGKRRYHFYSMKPEEAREGIEEKETINLLQLKHQLEGRNTEYADSQKSLQLAHHVIARYWERNGEPIQIIFFGIEGENVSEKTMGMLSEVIAGSLRKGDAAVKCGRFQYIAVLLNASSQNCEMVAKRIKKNFEEKLDDTENTLVYEMRSID